MISTSNRAGNRKIIKKEKMEVFFMKSTTFKPMLISVMLALLLSAVGCTSMTGETAGQYVDDSTITATVKAKLVGEKAANFTRVDVDTTNKVVSLNGIVESPAQKDRAEQLAMQVGGVRRVQNNLQIQGRN
jgi:hyperosmotically inducible periplasmic protein